jgi:exodeoxyribonuclease V gamma subunit
MLKIWRSDRLEVLAEKLAGIVGKPPVGDDPFEPEIVVVQSGGMRRWLSLQLAGRLGIAANIRFPFPAAYTWELIRRADPDVPAESPFDQKVLAWRIWSLLDDPGPPPSWAPLTRWLAGGNHPARRFDLAARIAQVFDGYLVYRHEWPEKWQAGKVLNLGPDEAWQADLWRKIAKASGATGGRHPRAQFLARLGRGEIPAEELPRRISLFALSDLAPLYAGTFRALAERIEVNVFLAVPGRAATREKPADPLLDAWGGQARALQGGWPGEAIDSFRTPGDLPATLLGRIQAAVLSDSAPHPETPGPDDRSFQVHLCHGPVREMEVLHDRLLDLFDRDPTLTPGDVAILTPDPGTYAPYAEAVFKGAGLIPLAVTDRGGSAGPVVQALLALLDLGKSRWEASRVLTLLENPCVARRFELTPDDLERTRLWLDQAGIRWGLDAGHRTGLGLPGTSEHTWEAGLDRLLMGRAAEADGTTLVAGILPFPGVEGNDARSLERLAECLDGLRESAAELGEAHTPAGWSQVVTAAMGRLFSTEGPDEEKERNAVRAFLASLADTTSRAGVAGAIPAGLFRDLAAAGLAAGERSPFPSGSATFGALVPGRTLPFRVICLAGMNDGAFPRVDHPAGFDLAASRPETGDRDRRREDLGLLLETLAAACDALLVTCTGRDARDDHAIPPAAPVTGLIEHVALIAGTEPGRSFVHVHPLQPFSRRYFEDGGGRDRRLFSYESSLCDAAKEAAAGRKDRPALVPEPLGPEETGAVTVADLVRFYQAPARQFLKQRLGVSFPDDQSLPADREPFDLSVDFAETSLRRRIADALLRKIGMREIEAAERASGMLPPGELGRIHFRRAAARMDAFVRTLEPLLAGGEEVLDIDETLAGVRVTGRITCIGAEGPVLGEPVKSTSGNRVKLWIPHLFACLQRPGARSRLVTLGRLTEFSAPADPRALLEALLRCYRAGLREPLPFFPRSSLVAADALKDPRKSAWDARKAARNEWRGAEYDRSRAEANRPWYRLAFRDVDPTGDDRFMELVRTLAVPIVNHQG